MKAAIETIFATHELSISKLWGQGYNGASNMRDQFNGLKVLILNKNSSAYHIHWFAHQLQLVLVVIAENHPKVDVVFTIIAYICNVVEASAKRRDIF